MTGTGVPPVGVGNVKVEDPVTTAADALLHGGLLDVHMEGIQEQPQGVRTHRLQQVQPLGHRIDVGRLVAVDRLDGDTDPLGVRGNAQLPQPLHQPLPGGLTVLRLREDPPNQPDDHLGFQLRCQGDVFLHPADRRGPH